MSSINLPESQKTIHAVYEFVNRHDKSHATKFSKLNQDNQSKAATCIKIHLKNCKRAGVPFDLCAVKEIITDAQNGTFFMLDNERERKQPKLNYYPAAQSSLSLMAEI